MIGETTDHDVDNITQAAIDFAKDYSGEGTIDVVQASTERVDDWLLVYVEVEGETVSGMDAVHAINAVQAHLRGRGWPSAIVLPASLIPA
ncbi:MAG: hypothetical protein AAF743_15210 [Planctomycetota bacterium]